MSKDWGRSDNDQRHRLVLNGLLQTSMQPAETAWEYLTHGFQFSSLLQFYSAPPFNITSGVTTIQGTAGRPVVDGEFIDRNAGDRHSVLFARSAGQPVVPGEQPSATRGALRRLQPDRSRQRRDAQHQLRCRGVSDQPVANLRSNHGGRRSAVIPIRRTREVLMGRVGLVEPLMKAIAPVTMLLAVCAVSAQDRTTALKVDGGTNAFPWIAAERSFVAVAWGVTVPEGGADVYVAVSRDAGRSFGSPVRVNTVSGAARLGGELPPRVALTPMDPGEPSIVVVWGAKAGTTDIRISQSTNGGRTFSESTVLSATGSPGDRGWHAAVVDSSGVVHTVWLDHRGLAARPKGSHDHHGDGADMAQFSGLYLRRGAPRTRRIRLRSP